MSTLHLETLVNYHNQNLLSRYQRDYPNAQLSADEALKELMKFIWLCHDHEEAVKSNPDDAALKFKCVVHEEMKDIDNMWHTFLLFTKDYHQFCDTYLNGEFFHHVPLTETVSHLSPDNYKLELANYLSYIYERLGEDTLVKWFE